jgi:methionyl aminopeptidase
MSERALMKAGYIASRVRSQVQKKVEAGTPIIEICDFVNKSIKKLGGKPAFPCNVDINHVAAHYTSPIKDRSIVPDGSLVKIDIGVHVDGYIADTATTICLEPNLEAMVDAAEAGLEAAIKTVKAGVKASEIGTVIERTIKSMGFQPIRNLTGHKLARYVVHAGFSIPNVSSSNGHKLNEGDVYAIEPFSVPPNASGLVTNGQPGNIFLFKKKRNVKNELAKKMLKFIQGEYRSLPFASRWVYRKFPEKESLKAFSELHSSRCLYSYPQLIEKSHKPVAQAEHTVIVTKDGCLVTTS